MDTSVSTQERVPSRQDGNSRNWLVALANNELLIKRWIGRHLSLEFLLCIMSFYIMSVISTFGTYFFFATLFTIIGALIPFCCVRTNVGWEINIVFQLISLLLNILIFLASLVQVTRGNLKHQSMISYVIILLCSLTSILSIVPFMYLSGHLVSASLTTQRVLPTIDQIGSVTSNQAESNNGFSHRTAAVAVSSGDMYFRYSTLGDSNYRIVNFPEADTSVISNVEIPVIDDHNVKVFSELLPEDIVSSNPIETTYQTWVDNSDSINNNAVVASLKDVQLEEGQH